MDVWFERLAADILLIFVKYEMCQGIPNSISRLSIQLGFSFQSVRHELEVVRKWEPPYLLEWHEARVQSESLFWELSQDAPGVGRVLGWQQRSNVGSNRQQIRVPLFGDKGAHLGAHGRLDLFLGSEQTVGGVKCAPCSGLHWGLAYICGMSPKICPFFVRGCP